MVTGLDWYDYGTGNKVSASAQTVDVVVTGQWTYWETLFHETTSSYTPTELLVRGERCELCDDIQKSNLLTLDMEVLEMICTMKTRTVSSIEHLGNTD